MGLSSYSDFAKEASVQYDALQQETNLLYKKHFVAVPFELKNYIGAGADGEDGFVSGIISGSLKDVNVKFDLIIGSGTVQGSGSKYVRLVKPDGIDPVTKMHGNDDKFAAFINANSAHVIRIDVPNGEKVRLNFLFVNSNAPLNVQIMPVLGDGATLELFELCLSNAGATSALGLMHEIEQGRDSNVSINTIHNENDRTVVFAYAKNRMGHNSNLKFNTLYHGGSHSRARNTFDAEGKESRVQVNEIIFGSKEQKFDIDTRIVNSGVESDASLETKAALMDTSFCIMKGFAKVAKGAHRSRSYVHERGILIDKGAKVDGLPDMSVDENDVKATHSSATAPVDAEAIFYMMSKGLTEKWVRKLLIDGFFAESMARVDSDVMREISMSLINSKLDTRAFGVMPAIGIKDMWVIASDVVKEDIFKGHYKYRE